MSSLFQRDTVEFLFIRVAVAFSFLYPPISAVITPEAWIGYFPAFVTALPFDSIIVLHAFGILEVAIALWILSGKNIFVPSVMAATLLLGIVAFNLAQMDVLFRDVSIALAAIALALRSRSEKRYNVGA